MRKMLALILTLMIFSQAALAYNPARFQDVEGVTVEYDPANPSEYLVKAGFASSVDWTMFGGHLVIRYLNAGITEEIPLILASFTASGITGMEMYVRTDAHRYQVTCTDLTKAELENAENEAALLVTPGSVEMLRDIAKSVYCSVSVWAETPAVACSFIVDDDSRRILSLFLEEYDEEIAPLLTTGSSLKQVYDELSPAVRAESMPDIGAAMQTILNTDYPELRRGSQGDDVVTLQNALIQLGHLDGTADGVFGRRTAEAVQSFQKTQDLTTSGFANDATQTALYIAILEISPVG